MDGKKIFENSVEEFITSKLKENLKFDDCKFSSSGREDVDVRMLGKVDSLIPDANVMVFFMSIVSF